MKRRPPQRLRLFTFVVARKFRNLCITHVDFGTGHKVSWQSYPMFRTVVRTMRKVLVIRAKAVLQARRVEVKLGEYDAYAADLRAFCRRYGASMPRLPTALQAELTRVRRGVAVLAKLQGTRAQD